jgi:hypothetical protein
LQLFQCHSRRPSAATPGARSIPKNRRPVDEMARSNRKCPFHTLRDSWRECWPGMCQNVRLTVICTLTFIWQVFPPAKVIFAGVGVLLSVCNLFNSSVRAIVTPASLRQLRMFEQVKTLLSTSSSASKCFSDASRPTRVPPTTEMMDIIMVEVLSILDVATKEIKQGLLSEYLLYIMTIV